MVEHQPICLFAKQALRKNSTKLLVAMCVGIALSVYGIYVHSRSHSNPGYESNIAVASHWLFNVANKIIHPTTMLNGCKTSQKATAAMGVGKQAGMLKMRLILNFIMQMLIEPMTHYAGPINVGINLIQIILLKIFCKSKPATTAIIVLSGIGFCVSMFCFIGSMASCKLMCISCLGIHHMFIIYYGLARNRIIKGMLCPPQQANSNNNCSYPGINLSGANANLSSGSGSCNTSGGNLATKMNATVTKALHSPTSKCTSNKMVFGTSSIPKVNPSSANNADGARRRSNRQL